MEWWSDGFETQNSSTPLLQHSISFACLASEFSLNNAQIEVVTAPLAREAIS